MSLSTRPKFLVVGIGNTLRSDDGVGSYICEEIEALSLPGTVTLIVQQLMIELVEEMTLFDHIILVDAAVNQKDVQFEPITDIDNSPVSTSHHVNASLLQALAMKLYNKPLSLWVCAIPAKNLGNGETISPKTKLFAEKGRDRIVAWIQSIVDRNGQG